MPSLRTSSGRLDTLEEARGYRTLIETQDFTQEEVSQAVGKSRPAITNALRLLNLPRTSSRCWKTGKSPRATPAPC